MIRVAVDGLPHMFDPAVGVCVHTRARMADGRVVAVGRSPRYTAIVALGARFLREDEQRRIFGGLTGADVVTRLIEGASGWTNLGDVALVAWASGEYSHPESTRVLDRLRVVLRSRTEFFTVEAAWALAALVAAAPAADTESDARRLRDFLVSSFSSRACVFSHRVGDHGLGGAFRRHVACFADQVYPIQALARLHRTLRDSTALEVADACAQRICDAQGANGQWWWHYDSRTGAVIEGYPVYSVHQDAMAPMALMDLLEAGGKDHRREIAAGVLWMDEAHEVGRSLIEEDLSVIWRKVGRNDPRKLVRLTRAIATRLNPSWRVSMLDRLFPARRIDFESRPYHLGWILYAWLGP
jgi:hypothetical protein